MSVGYGVVVSPSPPLLEHPEADAAVHDPAASELERAVLAVLLEGRYPLALAQVRSWVPHPGMLVAPEHRLIFAACLALAQAEQPVTALTVIGWLEQHSGPLLLARLRLPHDGTDPAVPELPLAGTPVAAGQHALAAVGGANAVFALLQGGLITAAGLVENAQRLRACFAKRRLVERLKSLVQEGTSIGCSYAHLVTAVRRVAQALHPSAASPCGTPSAPAPGDPAAAAPVAPGVLPVALESRW